MHRITDTNWNAQESPEVERKTESVTLTVSEVMTTPERGPVPMTWEQDSNVSPEGQTPGTEGLGFPQIATAELVASLSQMIPCMM